MIDPKCLADADEVLLREILRDKGYMPDIALRERYLLIGAIVYHEVKRAEAGNLTVDEYAMKQRIDAMKRANRERQQRRRDKLKGKTTAPAPAPAPQTPGYEYGPDERKWLLDQEQAQLTERGN